MPVLHGVEEVVRRRLSAMVMFPMKGVDGSAFQPGNDLDSREMELPLLLHRSLGVAQTTLSWARAIPQNPEQPASHP